MSTIPVRRVTSPLSHHFFGYYDKCPWNDAGSHLLAMQCGFMDRNPVSNEPLTIGMVSTAGGQFQPVAETRAWNWQQGCMLRWMPSCDGKSILFNDRQGDRYISRVVDVETGQSDQWDWPVYDITRDGRRAATLNFARLAVTRPGYGYIGLPDGHHDDPAPRNDGLYIIDVAGQSRELIFSVHDAIALSPQPVPADHKSWFNHIQFNPAGDRLIFFHRSAADPEGGRVRCSTRMIAINPDGSDPLIVLQNMIISHFDWYDDDHLIVWLESLTPKWKGYHLVNARTGQRITLANDLFASDGHCVFSPDRQWMMTDTYPQGPARKQTLMLYHMATGRKHEIGHFAALPADNDAWRCDLHARWNRTGNQVCFDSTHEGTRQMYVADVSSITAADQT